MTQQQNPRERRLAESQRAEAARSWLTQTTETRDIVRALRSDVEMVLAFISQMGDTSDVVRALRERVEIQDARIARLETDALKSAAWGLRGTA